MSSLFALNDRIFAAMDELDAAGISYENLRSEPLRMCGI